jgi:acyl-coenzyme A thioesterase PaaI-like protein
MHWGEDVFASLSQRSLAMNPATVSLFAASRRTHSLGLVLAGVIFALIGVGGSGAIVRNFVTAGSYAAAPVTAATVPA